MDRSDEVGESDGEFIFRSKGRCVVASLNQHAFGMVVFELDGLFEESSFCWGEQIESLSVILRCKDALERDMI